MTAKKADMQMLLERRNRLLAEIEALRNKVAGLDMAISLLSGDDKPQANETSASSGRSSVKGVVLDLLAEVGMSGLNAATAVEMSAKRGTHIDKQSVSSLLSRLKRDGVVVYEDERYKLSRYETNKSFRLDDVGGPAWTGLPPTH